jgi:hypothetical protein
MENKPKFVYGYFDNSGDGHEHYWHLGVCVTEEEAYEKFKDILNQGGWIGEIEVI